MLRAKVGMVFQKPTPFPMTIYNNIAFGVRLYERLPKAESTRASRIACAVARLGRSQDKLDASGLSFPAVSNSGSASRAPSRSNRR